MDEQLRKRHLELGRRRVAESEERVVEQYRIIERLKAAGTDTAAPQRLLASLEHFLEVQREHLTILEHRLNGPNAWELYYSKAPLTSEYAANGAEEPLSAASRSIDFGKRGEGL